MKILLKQCVIRVMATTVEGSINLSAIGIVMWKKGIISLISYLI